MIEPIIPKGSFQEIFPKIKKILPSTDISLHELYHISGNISLIELFYINLIIKFENPKTIIEFGTYNGRTTLNMAANSSADTKIFTVDLPAKDAPTKFELEHKQFDPNNDEMGYVGLKSKLFNNHPLEKKINQIWCDTAQLDIESLKDSMDLMFIDASHSYENCYNDSLTAFKLIKYNGIVIWHDYNGWPGVTEALNKVYSENNFFNMFWLNDTSLIIGRR